MFSCWFRLLGPPPPNRSLATTHGHGFEPCAQWPSTCNEHQPKPNWHRSAVFCHTRDGCKPSQYLNWNFAKKVQHRKCEPLGPVDSPNLHNYILIEILLQKVRHKKCDPFVCGIQVWSTGQTKPPQLEINGNYAKKVRHEKCDPLCGEEA